LLIGLVASAAAFINPNSLVFSMAFCAWFALQRSGRVQAVALMILGATPFIAAFHFAQAYCAAHPERMMHVMNDWRMVFHPELVQESFGMLNAHFAWLLPLFPSLGSLAFVSLVLLAAWFIRLHNWPMAIGISAAVALIVFSFAFAKTHDGTWSFLYPYSRMYLALPLLLCWCLATLPLRPEARSAALITTLIVAVAMSVLNYYRMQVVVTKSLAWPDLPVSERPIAALAPDLLMLHRLCASNDVQLIVGTHSVDDRIPAGFRCFLYPALDPDLPPTYLFEMERRYWQKDKATSTVFQRILVIGGRIAKPGMPMSDLPDRTDVSTPESGPLLLIQHNTLPTDSLMARVLRVENTR
jgi:hypothetical protein